jgi:hypothetical protein
VEPLIRVCGRRNGLLGIELPVFAAKKQQRPRPFPVSYNQVIDPPDEYQVVTAVILLVGRAFD